MSTESRHTPGPWTFEEEPTEDHNEVRESRGCMYAIVKILVIGLLVSCAGSNIQKRSYNPVHGRVYIYPQLWPEVNTCKTYHVQPLKPETYRHLSYWRREKRAN